MPLVRPVSVYEEALTGLALTFVYGPSGLGARYTSYPARSASPLSAQSRSTEVVLGVVVTSPVGAAGAVRSFVSRKSPKRKTRDAGVAVRLRCVAKMPAKVLGVPPVSSGIPVKKLAGTVTAAPTETGAPPSIR